MSYSVKLGGVLVPCLKTLVQKSRQLQKASLTRNCPYKGKNLPSTGGWFSLAAVSSLLSGREKSWLSWRPGLGYQAKEERSSWPLTNESNPTGRDKRLRMGHTKRILHPHG